MTINHVILAMVLAVGLGSAPLMAATRQVEMVDGLVTNINEPAGKITIKHGALPKFGMDDSMTMVFRVQDLAMLAGLKAGDAIKFVPERINGQFTATIIQKSGE